MKVFRLSLFLALAGAIALLAMGLNPGLQLTPARPTLPARSGLQLTDAKSWGYQLQGARPELIPPELDLLVIDHARDASATDLLSASDVEAFRQRPAAAPRIVLAYLSIGEAETYRFYWWKPWASKSYFGLLRPGWLGRENKEWKGNFQVRYWHPGWQRLIANPTPTWLDKLRETWLGAQEPYIDKVLDAGFDGVYLDRVDAFSTWEKSHPAAEVDMIAFVAKISTYAKARRPGFLVVAQNGEELTRQPAYRRAIDGLAKEDLMFGIDAPERENAPDEITHSTQTLTSLRATRLPVFVVEYVSDPDKRSRAQRRMAELGFSLTFATRDLNTPPAILAPLPPQLPTSPVTLPAPIRATQQP